MKIFIVFVLVTLAFSGNEATYPKKCNDGWSGFGRNCYKYVAEVKTWVKAEQFCQSLGGHLASVHSNQTQSYLKNMGKISGSFKRTWIGAQDAVHEFVWMWTDGSVFDFSAFHPREPSNSGGAERCMEMNFGNHVLWNDVRCDTKLYFVCQKAANLPTKCKV